MLLIMALSKQFTSVAHLSSKYLIIMLFIVLPILSFFLGTQYQETHDLYQRQQAPITTRPSPTSVKCHTSLPTNSEGSDISANWKTYTNDKFCFLFKYSASYDKYLFIDDQTPHTLSLHTGVADDAEAKNGN